MSRLETLNKLPRSGLTDTMRSMGVTNRTGTSPPPRHSSEFAAAPFEVPKNPKSELSACFRGQIQHQWRSSGIHRPVAVSSGVNNEIQAILQCGGSSVAAPVPTRPAIRQISPIFGCSPPSRTGALNPMCQDMKFQKSSKPGSSLAFSSNNSSSSLADASPTGLEGNFALV